MIEKTCEHCGKPYTPQREYETQKFCGPICNERHYQLLRRQRQRELRRRQAICPICKKDFPAEKLNQVYCSPACRMFADDLKSRERRKAETRLRQEKAKSFDPRADSPTKASFLLREWNACDKVVYQAWLKADPYDRKTIEHNNPDMKFQEQS